VVLVRVLVVAGVHFVLAFVAAVVAYGWDLDRIPRSRTSSAVPSLQRTSPGHGRFARAAVLSIIGLAGQAMLAASASAQT
jgi:hypothetical protein